MRLAVVMYTNGALSGGAAKYLRRLIPMFLEREEVTELRLFLPQGALADIPAEWPVSEWKPVRFSANRIRKMVMEWAPEVVFVPTARWFDTGRAGSVVMVRNMEPLRIPVGDNGPLDIARQFVRRLAAKRACAKADRIIAVSKHVSDWLRDNWDIGEDRIGIVPHGVDPTARSVEPEGARGLVGRRFIFSAGSIRPARGIGDLVDAMAHPEFPADLDIAFAGAVDAGSESYHAKILAALAERGLSDRFVWLGRCGPEEMAWGFENCAVFVMTSRAEACPNTVLEAMSHGCLSVSCDTEPMPEFFQDAALYYESGDGGSLARAVGHSLTLPGTGAADIRNMAKARAEDFTWAKCADRTLALLARTSATS